MKTLLIIAFGFFVFILLAYVVVSIIGAVKKRKIMKELKSNIEKFQQQEDGDK